MRVKDIKKFVTEQIEIDKKHLLMDNGEQQKEHEAYYNARIKAFELVLDYTQGKEIQ